MNFKKRFLIATLFLFGLFITPTSSVLAVSTITAIPPRVTLTGKPGDVITTELKIRNDSDASTIYTVFVDDFIVSDTNGTPIPVSSNLNTRWSLKNWISTVETVPVDAKSSQVVKLTIRIPMTAYAGGHYAMVTYMPNAELKPGELKKTASIIGQRVGSLIYLTVAGPITENANLIKFSVPKFSEQGPITFTGQVENLSDIHIKPTGKITIFGPLNNQIIELPIETGNIFPETARDFSATWHDKWGYGRYKAELSLAYGSTGGILAATIFFWLFPIRMVIYLLITVISLLIVIHFLNRRNRKHQEMLEREVQELKKDLEQSNRVK